MNYDIWGLSAKENRNFIIGTFTFGIAIGWLFFDNIVIGIVSGIGLFSLKGTYKKLLLDKKKLQVMVQFRDMIYSLSSSVSTGRSIGDAIEESIEFLRGTYDDTDFIICALRHMSESIKKTNAGEIEVLKDFAYESGLDDVKDLVNVCETCKTLGGDLTKALNNSAEIIGDKITMEKELKTIVAQKKLEGRIVAFSPFAILLAIRLLSPAYLEPMYVSSAGTIVSAFALALVIWGWILIERVNSIEI
jgi:tight adherence protein B